MTAGWRDRLGFGGLVLCVLLSLLGAAWMGSADRAVATSEPAAVTAELPSAELAAFWDGVTRDAAGRGVAAEVVRHVATSFTLDGEIAALNANQPEFVRTAGDYVGLLVSQPRLANGLTKKSEHAELLARIEQRFGVDRHIVLAIWGIESAYGANLGERAVPRSLATLALTDSRRGAFWRSELLAAFVILQRGDIAPAAMTGSWAGAMGHTQFMPSTFLAHAVDLAGDGRRDIWGAPDDALASAANYLRASGWQSGQPALREVRLPSGFDLTLAAPAVSKPLAEWLSLGVDAVAGSQPLRDLTGRWSLTLPAGHRGPAFLVGANFRAILTYNRAVPYAIAVAHLADRLAGAGPLVTPWPADDRALAKAEREDLQRRLLALGHDIGTVDGIIGTATRTAIRSVQVQAGLPADGYPDAAFIAHLKTRAP
jgi:membrane-bound lytic murein transglycosylase B